MSTINCEICNEDIPISYLPDAGNFFEAIHYHGLRQEEMFYYSNNNGAIKVAIYFKYLNKYYDYGFCNNDMEGDYLESKENNKICFIENKSGKYLKLDYIKKYIDNLCFA